MKICYFSITVKLYIVVFRNVTASKMILLCRGLQRVTAQHLSLGTIVSGKVVELVNSLSASMERKFHRIEYNSVFAECAVQYLTQGLRS